MSRTLCFLTIGLVLAAIGRADDKQPAAKGVLEGDWKLASVQLNAQPLPMEKLQDARLAVRGPKYSLKLGDVGLEMTHMLLADKTPRAMDLTVVEGAEKGKTFHAILRLEGDTLMVCRSIEPGKERPTEFVSKPESGLLLVVWQRQKAE